MPRRKGSPVSNSTRAGKGGWKEKLTEEQLERKRAADRQLVRESRHRTRRTIETLQEQVKLLSNQQPNQLITNLMNKNKALEADRDALLDRLYSVCGALGLNKENAHSLITHSSDSTPSSLGPYHRHNHAPIDAPDTSENQPGEVAPDPAQVQGESENSLANTQISEHFDIRLELDSRILIPDSPSPFPQIHAFMDPLPETSLLSEETFLTSIMLWRQAWGLGSSVFSVASSLFHIHRAPGYMTSEKLRRLSQCPNILQDIVYRLDTSGNDPLEALAAPEDTRDSSRPSNEGEGRDNLLIVRRELVICAFECVRPWRYCSREARVAMFWALYRILSLLFLPTAQNLARCPAWFRPTASQMWHDHPSFIDFIPWPHIREHLVLNWPNFLDCNLYSLFLESFDINTDQEIISESVLGLNETGTELVLHPTIDRCLSKVSALTVKESFLSKFPPWNPATRPVSHVSSPRDPSPSAALVPDPDGHLLLSWLATPEPDPSRQESESLYHVPAPAVQSLPAVQPLPTEHTQPGRVEAMPSISPPLQEAFHTFDWDMNGTMDNSLPGTNTASQPGQFQKQNSLDCWFGVSPGQERFLSPPDVSFNKRIFIV